jgi:membrane-associated phospholipid phosphatase
MAGGIANKGNESARRSNFPAGSYWAQFAIVIGVVSFLALATVVYLDSRPYFLWDLAVTRQLQAASWPGVEILMRGISITGDSVLISGFLLGAAFLALFTWRARREAAVLVLAVAMGEVLKIPLKHIVGRPRPSPDLVNVLINVKEIQSFPSGHTVHYVVFFGFLAFLAWTLLPADGLRRATFSILVGMILLVGPSRIYLGAHWASDVVGGYLLGGVLLLGNILLYRRWSNVGSSPLRTRRASDCGRRYHDPNLLIGRDER